MLYLKGALPQRRFIINISVNVFSPSTPPIDKLLAWNEVCHKDKRLACANNIAGRIRAAYM